MPEPNENQPSDLAEPADLEEVESSAEPADDEAVRFGGLHEMSNKPGGQGGTQG